ncbi:MAG TPA: MFS transporter, partial [Herpetosiphonaceae bacterium]
MRGLPRAVYRILVASFFSGMGMSLAWLFLNFHLEGLGFDRRLIGYANAIPAVSMVTLGIPAGFLIPQLGYGRSLRLGVVLGAIALGVVAWARAPLAVFAALLVYGLSQAVVMGATAPLLSALVDGPRRVSVLSWQAALSTGAGFVGNLAGGFLALLVGGPGGMLALAAAVFILSWLPLLGLRAGGAETRTRFRMARPLMWLKLLLPALVIGLGAGLIMPFLNLYLETKFALSFELLGSLFAFSSLATMGAMLIQPALVRRLGKVGAIVAVQAASLPFILILAYVPLLPIVTVALFVRGALMNAAGPVYTALVMELLNEEEQSVFLLSEAAIWNIGWALGSSLSGRLQAGM